MKNQFSIFFLFFITLIIGSCKKDNLSENPKSQPKTYSEFIVENDALDQSNPVYMYMMLTNQEGEIVYETLKPEKNARINPKVVDGDIIDLTVLDKDLRIYTFRNIQSGFRLSAFSSPFFESCYGDIKYLKLNIKITEIKDYEELYFGFHDEIEKQENSILIANTYIYFNDRTITILPKGSSEYVSYLIKWQDLDFINNELAEKEINIDEFSPTSIYQVAVAEKGKYTGYLTMWDDDKFSFTNRKNGYQDLEKGDKMSFFVSHEQSDLIKELGITKKNESSTSYRKYLLEQLPETVSLSTPSISIDANGTAYNYSSTSDFDLAWVNYSFNDSNIRWSVFQKGNDKTTYKLPNLKADILSGNQLSNLKLPSRILLETYKFSTGMDQIDDVFDMCRDYESVSTRKKL